MSFTKETGGLANRSRWPSGPWDGEPDKIEWEIDRLGFECLIVRHPSFGHLCGYVGVAEGHPWYGVDADAIEPSPDVHGGLTASDWGDHLLHAVLQPSAKDLWWLGFDCAHAGDLVPAMSGTDSGRYRDVAFVKSQCERLAVQADAAEQPASAGSEKR